MMQAIIRFSLPEDEELFKIYFHAPRRAEDMRELHKEMRNIAKYGINDKFDTVEDLADYIYRGITWEYGS